VGGQQSWSTTYGYDRYGNRTSVIVNGAAADGSPIPPDGLQSVLYDPATNHASPPSSYDAAGNVTRSQRADASWLRYRYDAAGNLAAVLTDGGQFVESYSYAADGHRLVASSAGESGRQTYFAWDRDEVLAEFQTTLAGGALTWLTSSVYLGSQVLATLEPGASGNLVRYRHADRLGVRLVTDNRTPSAASQVTLPFGTVLSAESSSTFNPIFTSYERDVASGLDHAINRYYDSRTRFIQVDPADRLADNLHDPQSLNMYSYVGNDPVNRTDATGLGVLAYFPVQK